MAKVNGLWQDTQEINVRVAYHNYLACQDNPLRSFEDFAEDFWIDLMIEEDIAEDNLQASQFGAGA